MGLAVKGFCVGCRFRDLVSMAASVCLLTGCTGDVPSALTGSDDDSAGDAVARCTTPADAEILSNQLLQLINLERSERGIGPVVPDSADVLKSVAADYACSMIQERFFSHEHPATKTTPAKRITSSGYRASAVGENLAAGQRSAGEVVKQWMNSESHRQNLLSPEWREAGVAVRAGGTYDIYWVIELAAPRRMEWDFEYPVHAPPAETTPSR